MNTMPAVSGQDPSVTGYALLGLFSLREEMSGYELKQLADRTLKFFWTAPAMSHVYSELKQLAKAGLVEETVIQTGARRRRRYRLSASGRSALEGWLSFGEVGFPGLKHEVVLRLFLGAVSGPARPRAILEGYKRQLEGRIAELRGIRDGLGEAPHFRYAAIVADWGMRYYREELESVADAKKRLGGP